MADGTPRIVSPFARPAVSDDTPPPYAYEMIDGAIGAKIHGRRSF
jgi:hypothetical protein